MVLRTEERADEARRQMRLPPPPPRGRQPVERQAELALEFEMMLQARAVVGVQRDDKRALRTQVHSHVAFALELGGEVRPQRLARAIEGEQLLLARFHLGAGREHAGRRVTRALPGRAALEDCHARAPLRESPADRETDDARADDGDMWWCSRHRLFPPLALP